jgi:hypothetical protein
MRVWYSGTVRNVIFSADADTTKPIALSEVGAHKFDATKAQLHTRLKMVGDVAKVSEHILRFEGGKVYGVKTKHGVRGYGCFGTYEKRASFIVHFFTKKDWKKMKSQDRDRVVNAHAAFEQAQELEKNKQQTGGKAK